MSHLGGGVDELDVNLLGSSIVGLGKERLSKSNSSLSGSHDSTSDHEEVVVDNSIMGESSERGDVLLSNIGLSGGVVLDTSVSSSSDSVDLFVDLSSVMIT